MQLETEKCGCRNDHDCDHKDIASEEQEYKIEIDKVAKQKEFQRASEERKKKEPTVKIGRNDKCPCGSGKKFKKCCLGKIMNRQPVSVMKQIAEKVR